MSVAWLSATLYQMPDNASLTHIGVASVVLYMNSDYSTSRYNSQDQWDATALTDTDNTCAAHAGGHL